MIPINFDTYLNSQIASESSRCYSLTVLETNVYYTLSTASGPGVKKIDASGNITNILTNTNKPPGNDILPRAIGITQDGKYLFVAGRTLTGNQIIMIDISDPSKPIAKTIKLSYRGIIKKFLGNIYVNDIGGKYEIYMASQTVMNRGIVRVTDIDFTNGTGIAVLMSKFKFNISGITYNSGYLYTVRRLANKIYAVDFNTGTKQLVHAEPLFGSLYTDISSVDGYFFVTNLINNNIQIFKNATAPNLTKIDNFSTSESNLAIFARYRLGYVTLFYVSLYNAILKAYPSDSPITGIGGDPHIIPRSGIPYQLENKEGFYRLFNNNNPSDSIKINAKCSFLSKAMLDDYLKHNKKIPVWVKNAVYLRYICIMHNDEKLIIDMETLNPVKFTNDVDFNKNTLPEIQDNATKTIQLFPKTISKNGLYSITHKCYRKNEKTYDRAITVTGKYEKVLIVLSVDHTNDDRNYIKLQTIPLVTLDENKYSGALIRESKEIRKNYMFE